MLDLIACLLINSSLRLVETIIDHHQLMKKLPWEALLNILSSLVSMRNLYACSSFLRCVCEQDHWRTWKIKIHKLIQVWCLVVAHCTKNTISTCNIQSVEPLRTAINWKFSSLIISDMVEYFCTLFWLCLFE